MAKRTELMIFEDRAKVCELQARGVTNRSEMARIINKDRDERFHISAQQIAKDIKLMEEEYLERGFENIEIYRHQAMNELLYLIKVAYESFELSRKNKVTVESFKEGMGEDEYDEIVNQDGMEQEDLDGVNLFARDGKVKEESRGEGNPAFLSIAKSAMDSLNKIRTVDGATKIAMTDATGTQEFTGMAELMKQRMDDLSTRQAPTDTDKFLLDAVPEDEQEDDGVIDGEVE
jgi:hypothetical protein